MGADITFIYVRTTYPETTVAAITGAYERADSVGARGGIQSAIMTTGGAFLNIVTTRP